MSLRNLSGFVFKTTRKFSSTPTNANVARMTLVGRVGAEPIKQESKNGNIYLKYPLAVSTSKDQTSWFNILAFDQRLIEFMDKYISKGSLVYVEADASMSKYVSEDGSNRTSLSLIQQSIHPLTWPKREFDNETASAEAQSEEYA